MNGTNNETKIGKYILYFILMVLLLLFPQLFLVLLIIIICSSKKDKDINNNYSSALNEFTMCEKMLDNTKATLTGRTQSKVTFDIKKITKAKIVMANKVNYEMTYNYINNYSMIYAEKVEEVQVDPEYLKGIDEILEDKIKEELVNNKVSETAIVPYIKRRKYALSIIFAILNFVCISFIFFHLPLWTLLLEVINVIIFLSFNGNYNLISYLKKQIKARPDEKISDIVSSLVVEQVPNNKVMIGKVMIIVSSFIIPIFIYFTPHIFYETYEDGYGVRFYTIGINNFTKVEIPETHNGRKVLSIRGNVFANILTLREVILPDSIEEIRGNAFLNDMLLEEIELPDNLKYLGGSAFKNCRSLKQITIPIGVTEINGETFKDCVSLEKVTLYDEINSIHGETFVNCMSLKEIKLPVKITEINGYTFENCSSLRKIEIPEGVKRIGGHAFYGCSSLASVYVPDSLEEIGSSAFRLCSSLKTIEIPNNTVVNSRAFKESPTVVKRRNSDLTENVYE